jgi:hypothetical protein
MTKPYKKPRVIISSLDTERLEQLIESLSDMSFPGKDDLEVELVRAEIESPRELRRLIGQSKPVCFLDISSC